jgi:ABC-type multidrug transport system fused ATPase/permease subunit
MEHQTLKEKVELLTEHIGDFLETKKDLAVVNAAIIGTNIASTSIVFLIIYLFILLFLLFASIALALWLGYIFENAALGFIATGSIYLVFGIICMLLRKRIVLPIKDVIVNLIYDKD